MSAQEGLNRPSIFIEVEKYSIDLSLYSLLSDQIVENRNHYLSDETDRTAEFLEKFQGSILCVSESFVSENWHDFWSGKGAKEIQKMKQSSGSENKYSGVGRPNLGEMLLGIFDSQNPEGRKNKPWKVVEQEIENEFGQAFNISTLQKHLRKRGKN